MRYDDWHDDDIARRHRLEERGEAYLARIRARHTISKTIEVSGSCDIGAHDECVMAECECACGHSAYGVEQRRREP